jgi:iron(II)-dependent oxidoreductase
VTDFPEGASVGGVYQLIGNVWEWTSSPFTGDGNPERQLVLTVPLKSLRGGAFDTYFENQATCQFQSGDSPLARKPNIGIRCAVALSDLAAEVMAGLSADGAQEDDEEPAARSDADLHEATGRQQPEEVNV